jgi:hypothetical protein
MPVGRGENAAASMVKRLERQVQTLEAKLVEQSQRAEAKCMEQRLALEAENAAALQVLSLYLLSHFVEK